MRSTTRFEHTERTYHFLIMESNLSHSHTPILLQITPRRVDDRDVILFIACTNMISSPLIFVLALSSTMIGAREHTINTISLSQLRTILQQLGTNLIPRIPLIHA